MSRSSLLAALLLAALPLLGAPQTAQGRAVASKGPVFELRHMTYVASNGPVNEMVLNADSAQVFLKESEARLQHVHAHFQAPGNVAASGHRGSLDMECDRGTFSLETGDFVAEGHVRGVTGDGRRFETTRLAYHRSQAMVTTDQPVLIQDATGAYRGGGFRYYVRDNRFRLVGGAEVVQEP